MINREGSFSHENDMKLPGSDLEKNKDIPDKPEESSRDKSEKRTEADLERLAEMERKAKVEEEFTEEDLRFLYEVDIKMHIDYQEKDPRIAKLLAGRDRRTDISKLTGHPREEISITEREALNGGFKFHLGDLNLAGIEDVEGMIFSETMKGSIYMDDLIKAKAIQFPKKLRGNISMYKLKDIRGLKFPEKMDGIIYLDSLSPDEKQTLREEYPELEIA